MKNTCPICGKPCNRRWCSQLCNAVSRRRGKTIQCLYCEKPFYLRPAHERKGGGKHCSDLCRRNHKAEHSMCYAKVGTKAIHRIVAAQKLGRPLMPGEVVHHIDGNKRNNHPDNLIVLPSQSAHMKLEFAEGNVVIRHEQAVENGKRSAAARRLKALNKI